MVTEDFFIVSIFFLSGLTFFVLAFIALDAYLDNRRKWGENHKNKRKKIK